MHLDVYFNIQSDQSRIKRNAFKISIYLPNHRQEKLNFSLKTHYHTSYVLPKNIRIRSSHPKKKRYS